jgi:hypothetical protein
MTEGPGLCNSIHSSLEDAVVPAQATSLIRMDRIGNAVDGGVGTVVREASGEGVAERVMDGVWVELVLGVGVLEGVASSVKVAVPVGDCVGVWVGEGVRVAVAVDCQGAIAINSPARIDLVGPID